MSKISKVRESGKEFVLSMVEREGMDKTALFFGYVRPDGSGNGGVISNIIKDEGWRETGGTRKPAAAKPAKSSAGSVCDGYLPGRVADWVVRKLGGEPDDGDTLPEGFGPNDFMELEDVKEETTNYQRLLHRLCPDKELNPFRAWLGCGLTRAERAERETAARIASISRMDADREDAEIRFESMRYDAAITAFYAAE